jgi:hypothetical protein
VRKCVHEIVEVTGRHLAKEFEVGVVAIGHIEEGKLVEVIRKA